MNKKIVTIVLLMSIQNSFSAEQVWESLTSVAKKTVKTVQDLAASVTGKDDASGQGEATGAQDEFEMVESKTFETSDRIMEDSLRDITRVDEATKTVTINYKELHDALNRNKYYERKAQEITEKADDPTIRTTYSNIARIQFNILREDTEPFENSFKVPGWTVKSDGHSSDAVLKIAREIILYTQHLFGDQEARAAALAEAATAPEDVQEGLAETVVPAAAAGRRRGDG